MLTLVGSRMWNTACNSITSLMSLKVNLISTFLKFVNVGCCQNCVFLCGVLSALQKDQW